MTPMTPAAFKAARQRVGLTVRGLAEALDIGKSSVSRYEDGSYPVPRVVQLAIAYLEHSDAAQKPGTRKGAKP